jgi:transposase
MRKIKEILRVKWEVGLAARQIAQSLSISHSTVVEMLRRAEQAGFTWPLPNLDDGTLEAQLYPGNPEPKRKRPEPDMAYIHRELRRKGVTLQHESRSTKRASGWGNRLLVRWADIVCPA